MVSTRQMSNVGGHNGGSDGAGPSHAEPVSVARVTRHSSTIQPSGSSSPQQTIGGTSNKCMSLMPVSKHVYAMQTTKQFIDLPIEIVEKILQYVGFKTVSQLRLVSRQFNTICSSVLNSTFHKLQNKMLIRFQAIKAKMPRRESARRSHPLACESDIIETLHMRLSLLQMTLGKHIERKHCCFFPGEILDEVYSILAYLKATTKLARPYKVTDELFDLTTMAMEYFKEHIEPDLPEITYFGTEFFDITFSPGESKSYMCLESPPPSGFEASNSTSSAPHQSALSYLEESLPPSPPPPQSNMVLRKRIHRIKQGMKKYNDQLSALRSDLRTCKRKTALQQKQIMEQQKQISDQQKQIVEYANRLDDYDKKSEESSRKFQTLLQELNKCKTELQYWRSRSPAVPPLCADCSMAAAASSQLIQDDLMQNNEPEVVVEPETAGTSAKLCVSSPECKPTVVVHESSSDETTATPPARRRPSSDTATPERKKRRLTRPRKL